MRPETAYTYGREHALTKLGTDPTMLGALGAAFRQVGTAAKAGGRAAGGAYAARVQELAGAPLSGFSRATAGATKAVPAAVSAFVRNGGAKALLPIGGAGLAAYGAKSLYDKIRAKFPPSHEPRPMSPGYGMF